jgi:hypothetical protein
MRICLLCIFSLIIACTQVQTQGVPIAQYSKVNDSAIQLIRNGDLILRTGKDQLSQLFKNLNTRNKTYSHCGIAMLSDSGILVCHIIGTTQNTDGRIVYEPIDTFIQSKGNSAWAIIRYDFDSVTQQELIQKIDFFARQNISFDTHFDLATDDKMYCSEMVYKALLTATKNKELLETTIAQSGKKYVAIDNLFEHKHCKTICEIAYK